MVWIQNQKKYNTSTQCWSNVSPILGHSLRCWPGIKPTSDHWHTVKHRRFFSSELSCNLYIIYTISIYYFICKSYIYTIYTMYIDVPISSQNATPNYKSLAYTKHRINVCLMLGHRLRRWPIIKQRLVWCFRVCWGRSHVQRAWTYPILSLSSSALPHVPLVPYYPPLLASGWAVVVLTAHGCPAVRPDGLEPCPAAAAPTHRPHGYPAIRRHRGLEPCPGAADPTHPANTIHWFYIGSTLGQRRRRWPNIETI